MDLLASGKTVTDTAVAIEVTRQTVSEWLNHHPGFQAALNRRRQELWSDMVDGLRALTPQALAVLARELDGEAPLAAAIYVLKATGLYGGVAAPRGETDPQVLAAAMQVADDARQHAAEDAALTIHRKAYDRSLAGLHSGLGLA